VRKLPLGGSLYQQQQHALARHQPGEQPVRTAPTPSLPPTPCLIDTAESRLPGAAAAEPKAEEAAGEVEIKRRFLDVADPDPVSVAYFDHRNADPEYGAFIQICTRDPEKVFPGSRISYHKSNP
jgi:hypothetical protein